MPDPVVTDLQQGQNPPDNPPRIKVTWPQTEVNVSNIEARTGDDVLNRLGYDTSLQAQITKAGLNVATQFLDIFKWALFLLLGLLGVAITLTALGKVDTVDKAVDIFKTALATFASLLAFVMGYYFGQNPPTNNGTK